MSEDQNKQEEPDQPEESGSNNALSGLMTHLIELRSRLLRSLAAIAAIFVVLSPFSDRIYGWLAKPLMAQLPKGESMIAIGVASPFLIPFKLTLLVAVVLAIPFILSQIWAFVAPGLYEHEKRMVFPLLVSSTLLFYGGMAFAYFIVFPVTFRFFMHTAPAGVKMMTDISAYLDFVTNMFLAFGAAFEVPVAIILLTAMGVVTPKKLVKARPYIVVSAFVVAMFLTPPDVLSQISLAVPLLVLFEVGLLFSKIVYKRRKAAEETAEDEDSEKVANAGSRMNGKHGSD